MKRAVICGVSGQDGAFLTRLLLEKQYHVIGVSRNIHATSFENLKRLNICDRIEKVSATMVDFRNVIELVHKYQPDEIYNLSGRSSVTSSFSEPFDTFESVAMAVLNLLEAIRILKLPVKLFNAGSSDCFGTMDNGRATEQTPFRPKSPYGVAKAAAFWQVVSYRKIYGLFACTGILFNHESFLRPDWFVTRKIVKTACKIAKGQCSELVLGDISIERDWGWAPEYVEAMWKMMQQNIPDDYIIATGTTMSLEKFIATVFQRMDLDWKKYVKTDSRFLRPSDILTNSANTEKAEKQLGWKARYTGEEVAKMMVDAELKNMQGK